MMNRHERRKAKSMGEPVPERSHPLKKSMQRMKSYEDLNAQDLVMMHRQVEESLHNMGIASPTDKMLAKTQVNVAERNLELWISMLAFVLTRILDAYHHSKTHTPKKQMGQFKYAIEYIGKYEHGGRLDDQIDITIENVNLNLEWVTELYETLGYATEEAKTKADLEEGREVIEIAMAFRDATNNLLDGIDQGKSLISAIEAHQGDIQRLRGAAMQATAPKYGGPKNDPQMDADILDTVKRLGNTKEAMEELVKSYPELGDPNDNLETFQRRVRRLQKKQGRT